MFPFCFFRRLWVVAPFVFALSPLVAQTGGALQVEGTVYAVAVQADGRVVAGGEFNQAGGSPAQNLVIYAADGSVAANDSPAIEGTVRALSSRTTAGFAAGGQFQLPGSSGRNALLQD